MKTLLIKTPLLKDIKILSSTYFQLIKTSHSFFNKDLVEANEEECFIDDILMRVPLERLEFFFSMSSICSFDIMMDSSTISLKYFYAYFKDFQEMNRILHILINDQDLKPIKGIPTQYESGYYAPNCGDFDSVLINGIDMCPPCEEFPHFYIDFIDVWQTIFTMY